MQICPEEGTAHAVSSRLSDFGELFNSLLIHKELGNLDYNENFFSMNQS